MHYICLIPDYSWKFWLATVISLKLTHLLTSNSSEPTYPNVFLSFYLWLSDTECFFVGLPIMAFSAPPQRHHQETCMVLSDLNIAEDGSPCHHWITSLGSGTPTPLTERVRMSSRASAWEARQIDVQSNPRHHRPPQPLDENEPTMQLPLNRQFAGQLGLYLHFWVEEDLWAHQLAVEGTAGGHSLGIEVCCQSLHLYRVFNSICCFRFLLCLKWQLEQFSPLQRQVKWTRFPTPAL